MKRIYLSPPHMSGKELEFVREAFDTNWLAPLGPHVDAFEREFVQTIAAGTSNAECRTPKVPAGANDGRRTIDDERAPLYATALSSGTAALHLALRILGLQRGGEVVCSTFTFAASANAIAYEGGVPVFIDCDAGTWNMAPGLLHEELAACAKRGKLPRAVIVVDLYGQCADYDPILAACAEYDVPVIEDAAEALGAAYWGKEKAKVEVKAKVQREESSPDLASTSTSASARFAGSFGKVAAFSFNGNKVITTAGGGMLVSHDKSITDKARFLATQARDKAPHYQHSEIGFNYRMSNVLAAIGRGQLTVLSGRIAARRRNFDYYRRALGDLSDVEFMPEATYGRCTRWLTCLTLGKAEAKAEVKPNSASTSSSTCPQSSVLGLIQALEAENIEARPLWKPMHLQPVFKDCRVRGGAVSERLFENGLCLPSGSALTEEDLERVCAVVRRVQGARAQ